MNITTVSDFRKDIKAHLDDVVNNVEPLVIKRSKNNGVVVISLDEYNALLTTQHEMSSVANVKRLDRAIDRLNKNHGEVRELIEK